MPDTLVQTDTETNKNILFAAMAAALLHRLDKKLPETAAKTIRRKLGVAKGETTNLDGG